MPRWKQNWRRARWSEPSTCALERGRFTNRRWLERGLVALQHVEHHVADHLDAARDPFARERAPEFRIRSGFPTPYPLPTLGGDLLGTDPPEQSRGEWIKANHRRVLRLPECAELAEKITADDWRLFQWVVLCGRDALAARRKTGDAEAKREASQKLRTLRQDSFRFLRFSSYLQFLPEWREANAEKPPMTDPTEKTPQPETLREKRDRYLAKLDAEFPNLTPAERADAMRFAPRLDGEETDGGN